MNVKYNIHFQLSKRVQSRNYQKLLNNVIFICQSTYLSLIITRICIIMYIVNACLHINCPFCIFGCLFIMKRNNWSRQIYSQYFDVLRPFKHEYHQNNDGPFYIFLESCKLLYQWRYIYSDIMYRNIKGIKVEMYLGILWYIQKAH